MESRAERASAGPEKRRLAGSAALAAACLLASIGQLALAAAQPRQAARAPKPPPAAAAAAPIPAETRAPYEAYAVADAADGRVREGLNIHRVWPQASLTKLMLACVVMDRIEAGLLRLGDRVRIGKAAEQMGGSQVFLKAGEVFTLEELMQAAMIESANDAAYAVAEHAAGSAGGFVALMNAKAQALGMADTRYFSVHGLPPSNGDGLNVTTCSDLVRLAREALRHRALLRWTATEQTTFRRGALVLTNKNKLVGRLPEVDGLKTGFTRQSGFNIVATGRRADRRLIVVVLGSPEGRIRDAFAAEKLREHLAD
jgi:D-alanyl-D-alanine carboxypeptidase (penicillin-binding protein 5/6)